MKKKVKDLLKMGAFGVNGSLWIEGDGQRFFGPGPVELLELIEKTGSISKAAKELIAWYRELRERFREFLERESEGLK